MISVTSDMVLRATIFSLVLGVVSGSIYAVFARLTLILLKMVFKNFRWRKSVRHTSVFRHVFDFVYVVAIGFCYILSLYVFTDGVFFLCTLAALFLGFMLSVKTLSSLFFFFL